MFFQEQYSGLANNSPACESPIQQSTVDSQQSTLHTEGDMQPPLSESAAPPPSEQTSITSTTDAAAFLPLIDQQPRRISRFQVTKVADPISSPSTPIQNVQGSKSEILLLLFN